MTHVGWALRCAVCGAPLDARGDLFRCSDDHPGVLVHADTAHGRTNIIALRDERTSEELVLKIRSLSDHVTTNEQLERTTANEAATIARLSQALGSGPYRVPELVVGAVSTRGLLMRRLHGRCLEDELYGAGAWLRPRGVGRGSERAGEWLARLVTSTEVGRMPFSPDETVARAREFLEEIAERGHSPAKVSRLADLVASAAAGTAGQEIARCIVHGDFRPRHVFLAADSVTVIDFEQATEGWAHEDAAFYLAALDGFLAQYLRRRWSPGARIAGLRFLAPYLSEAPPGWATVGRLFRAAAMVRALNIDYRGKLARTKPRLFRSVVLPHYERWFRAWERAETSGRAARP